MAVPRVFISSTCYDLHEIRFQLHRFISDIGYDPVMSEFGDIFYDSGQHVQDACKEEIARSNVFVLIIGNNYGSIYHRHINHPRLPDSITLQEFRKAIEVNIPKYIFINRFVQYDFVNYRRILSKEISRYFSENDVPDDRVENVKADLKEKFDNRYPFQQEAYRYIFYFLDMIYNLEINNAIYPFESFENIRDDLRKQWAGFFYDSLTKEKTVALDQVQQISEKLEKIEKQLKLLTEGTKQRSNQGEIIINIEKYLTEMDLENLEKLQDRIEFLLNDILFDEIGNPRVIIRKMLDHDSASSFLDNLSVVARNYKWSKFIPITEIIRMVPLTLWENRSEVSHKTCLELDGIANSLNEGDRELLLNTVVLKFNESYEPKSDPEPNEDIPF